MSTNTEFRVTFMADERTARQLGVREGSPLTCIIDGGVFNAAGERVGGVSTAIVKACVAAGLRLTQRHKTECGED